MTGITSLLKMARGQAKARLGSRSASRSRVSISPSHRRRAESRSEGARTGLGTIGMDEIQQVRGFTQKAQEKVKTWRDKQAAKALREQTEPERERLRQLRREEGVVFSIPDPRFEYKIPPLERPNSVSEIDAVWSCVDEDDRQGHSDTTKSPSDTDTASSEDESTASVPFESDMHAISKALASSLEASPVYHVQNTHDSVEWKIVGSIDERHDHWKEIVVSRVRHALLSTAEGMERVKVTGTKIDSMPGGGVSFVATLIDSEEEVRSKYGDRRKYLIKVVLEIDWHHGTRWHHHSIGAESR